MMTFLDGFVLGNAFGLCILLLAKWLILEAKVRGDK